MALSLNNALLYQLISNTGDLVVHSSDCVIKVNSTDGSVPKKLFSVLILIESGRLSRFPNWIGICE